MMIDRNSDKFEAEELLLSSIINALTVALDKRTHFNVTHTYNMVIYASAFLDWMDETNNPWKFDNNKKNAFILSVWLHDVGKLTIPVHIMNKPTRLGYLIEYINDRFTILHLLNTVEFLRHHISEAEYDVKEKEIEDTKTFVNNVNKQGYVADVDNALLEDLKSKKYIDEFGNEHSWLTEEELECLSIHKGTLTEEERKRMESHVEATNDILKTIIFPERYKNVPLWAADHHELLDGSGYPRKIKGDEIALETRLLTIIDIFEALTAKDRPYKKPMSPEKALVVLDGMAKEGKIDKKILKLFKDSKAWGVDPIRAKEVDIESIVEMSSTMYKG